MILIKGMPDAAAAGLVGEHDARLRRVICPPSRCTFCRPGRCLVDGTRRNDAIIHCRGEKKARYVLDAIRPRLTECRRELHSTKPASSSTGDDDRRHAACARAAESFASP